MNLSAEISHKVSTSQWFFHVIRFSLHALHRPLTHTHLNYTVNVELWTRRLVMHFYDASFKIAMWCLFATYIFLLSVISFVQKFVTEYQNPIELHLRVIIFSIEKYIVFIITLNLGLLCKISMNQMLHYPSHIKKIFYNE